MRWPPLGSALRSQKEGSKGQLGVASPGEKSREARSMGCMGQSGLEGIIRREKFKGSLGSGGGGASFCLGVRTEKTGTGDAENKGYRP